MVNNILYEELSDIYDLIADDRDFISECENIGCFYAEINNTPPKRVLELFAGPAYHAGCFKSQYHCHVTAIDSSKKMKKIAASKNRVLPENYYLGQLPYALKQIKARNQFDIVLIMRYSLGLINYNEVQSLMTLISQYMAKNGLLILELHKISLLTANFDQLDIKFREKQLSDQQSVRCYWPSSTITWSNDDWQVSMPIKIDIVDHQTEQVLKSYQTCSQEYIYTKRDIDYLSAPLSLKPLNQHWAENLNPSCRFLIYQKS